MGALRVTVERKEPCSCVGTDHEGGCDCEDYGTQFGCYRDCGWCDGDLWVWRDVEPGELTPAAVLAALNIGEAS